MLIKDVVEKYKKDGTPVIKKELNSEYWHNVEKPCDVILDEAYNFMSARNSMSKANRLMNQWLALIRRVIGGSAAQYGDLILITQLSRQIDVIAREMSTQIQYCIMHSVITCNTCRSYWHKSSEDPEQYKSCPYCNNYRFTESNHTIEIMKFKSADDFALWNEYKVKTYYSHYFIHDVAKYFGYYDTLQWDSVFEDVYT